MRQSSVLKSINKWGGMAICGFSTKKYEPLKTRLSDFLEKSVPLKYYLSAKACLGILRRAAKRGKELPPILKDALMCQAGLTTEAPNRKLEESEQFNEPQEERREQPIKECQGTSQCADNPTAFGETGIGYWQPGIQTLRAEGENRPSRPSNVICVATQQANAEIAYDLCPTITEAAGTSGNNKAYIVETAGFMAGQGAKAGSIAYQEEVSPTLKSTMSGGNTVPSIVSYPKVVGTLCASGAGLNRPAGQGNEADMCIVEVAPSVVVLNDQGGASIAVEREQVNQSLDYEKVGSLNCMHDQQAIMVERQNVAGLDCRNGTENEDLSSTLQAHPGGGYSLDCTHPVRIGKTVRRLLPIECLRLMGLPDWWAADVNGSDTAIYKMCGNGVVVNCAHFIMRNIADVLNKN